MATDSTSGSRDPARPSSSTSELFGALYARGAAAAELSDVAWLQAMLDVEAALARACAREELIAPAEADAIAAACCAEHFDLSELAAGTARDATPVVALVRMLRERAGPRAHLGATSQDVIDTAAMLVARRALAPLLADAAAAANAAAALAASHRETPLMARTLLQHALPTSFGLLAAGWMAGIDAALARLAAVRDGELAVQMGGPVGQRDPAIAAHVAAELGLRDPLLPWHAVRVPVAELAGALGTLAGVLGKVARDVALLAQTDVGELREGGPGGGSSSMAHKRNPVASVSVIACVERVPGLVATLLAAMPQELQRAAGAWQAEWGVLTELLRLTGSAGAWARELLGGLQVDAARMLEKLDGTPDLEAAGRLVDRALAAHRR
jgi:3-carboxy-cis,cis-muconate cycloisomerase